MTIALTPARLARVLILVVACLVLGHVAVEGLRLGAGVTRFPKVLRLFDLASEANLPTWYSSAALLLAAALLSVIACDRRRARDRYALHWAALALVFLGLSLDEATGIHEMTIKRLRLLLGAQGLLHFTWVVPGMAFTAATALAFRSFLRDLPSAARWGFIWGGAIFVGGALGMEMVGGLVLEVYGRQSIAYAVCKLLEETAEMMGIVVFIRALATYIAGHIGEVRLDFRERGRPPGDG